MTKAVKEIIEIFSELSHESQEQFLMWARIAHISENAVRKRINQALGKEDVVNTEQKQGC